MRVLLEKTIIRTMKRILLILVAACCGLQTYAQNEVGRWTIIPKVGLNWAKTTDPEIYMAGTGGNDGKVKVETRTGLALGVEAEYQWKGQVSLSAGLVYSQQGSRWADAENVWKNYETKVDYLNVPILLNLYLMPGFAVKAGIQPALRVHNKRTFDEILPTGITQLTSSGDADFKTLELGIPIGASYAMGPVQLDLRYNIGLTYMRKLGEYFPDKNRVLQLTVGYRFEL